MFMKTLLPLALAALAAAQNSYDCTDARGFCELDGAADGGPDGCDTAFKACQDCNAEEQAAVHTIKDYAGQLNATKRIQHCYMKAETALPAYGPYDCKSVHRTCEIFQLHNNAGCTSQYEACRKCADTELSCSYAPGANQAKCSSDAANCMNAAIDQY